jgi:hypothetical protein
MPMTKEFKISKGPLKGKTVTSAPQTRMVRLQPFVEKVLDALGFPEAYVTDESALNDFAADFSKGMTPEELFLVSARLNLMCNKGDERIVDIAERLMGGH